MILVSNIRLALCQRESRLLTQYRLFLYIRKSSTTCLSSLFHKDHHSVSYLGIIEILDSNVAQDIILLLGSDVQHLHHRTGSRMQVASPCETEKPPKDITRDSAHDGFFAYCIEHKQSGTFGISRSPQQKHSNCQHSEQISANRPGVPDEMRASSANFSNHLVADESIDVLDDLSDLNFLERRAFTLSLQDGDRHFCSSLSFSEYTQPFRLTSYASSLPRPCFSNSLTNGSTSRPNCSISSS